MEPIIRSRCGPLRRFKSRVGRRGCALGFFALVDFVYGSSLVWASPENRATALWAYADSLMPLRVWGAAWICVGVACLVQTAMRQDRIAFAAAIAIKVAWSLVAALGWLAGELPRGYLSLVIWAAFAVLVADIGSWPEPGPRFGFTPEALISADGRGRIIAWNSAAVRMFGWSAIEILGRPLTTVIPPELRESHAAGFARAARERRSDLVGQVLPLEALRRDGRRFPVELTISVWTTGPEEVAFTGLVRDMSALTVERPQ